MAGEVFLIVFVACFLKAHSQTYANPYSGQCKPCIQEQSRLQPTILPEAADCISPYPKGVSTVQNPVKNPCSDGKRQTVLNDLGVNLQSPASNNVLNPYLLPKKPCSTNLEAGNPVCTDVSTFSKRAPQEQSFGLSKATCPIENNVSPLTLTDRSYYSCTSRPSVSNLVNVKQSPTVVVNGNVANTLAESLQLYSLNDLKESSLQCGNNYSPFPPCTSCQTASSLNSVNSIPTPFIPSYALGAGSFPYAGNNQPTPPSVETSVSVATSTNSLSSNNQVSSVSSAATTTEVSSSKTEPARFGNACGNFKNIPALSSNSFADSSTTIIDPQRVLNPYLTGNNGIAPYSSATAVSGVTNSGDSINGYNANYASSNAKSSSIPFVQESCPIQVDTCKGSNSYFNRGLINVVPSPFATSETLPLSYYSDQVRPIGIANQSPCNGLQPQILYPNACSPTNLYSSVLPFVDFGYSCPGPIGINPYGIPQELSTTTSSIAIAESNASGQSSVTISESLNDYSKITSPVTSTVATAESNDQTVSSVSVAKAETTVESPCEIESSAISVTNVATNPISEVSSLVATSNEPTPISTFSNGNALSSLPEMVSSPVLQGSFLETPVVLAVEIPSSIPSSAVANRFYGGLTSTACGREPFMYELQIPSSIPAQLSCNLGFVECEPVLCVNVEPVNFGIC